ncbi:MAG: hypothetical protein WBB10_17330, partial [Rhodococcus qingshengii]
MSSSSTSQFGQNQWLVDEMYQRFQDDPSSVDPSWHEFLTDYSPDSANTGGGNGTASNGNAAAPAAVVAPPAAPKATPPAPKTAPPAPAAKAAAPAPAKTAA